MPTYDYECQTGHRFEVFQKMSDEPVAECPECGAPAGRVIPGGAGFLFKGDGFYITDYRSDEYRQKASADRESTGESSSSPSPSSPSTSSGDSVAGGDAGGSSTTGGDA